MKYNKINYCVVLLFCSTCQVLWADIKEDLGYTALANELGVNLPDGAGVGVFQIEAITGGGAWMADPSTGEFSGKTISSLSSVASVGFSSHATGVGRRFYGNVGSLSPGVSDIGAHSADGWFFDELNLSTTLYPDLSTRRVANHSYVGNGFTNGTGAFSASITSTVLRVIDWYSHVDEVMQVYAPNNNGSFSETASTVLMATAYNGLVVGVTDLTHGEKVIPLDSIYVADRVAIDVVVPINFTSSAAPFGASASAMLISAGHDNPVWSQSSTTNRSGMIVYNAERIETIRASLLAGASRHTFNTTNIGDVQGYRQLAMHRADNGLDWRYGAGQINVSNSYHILAGGEHSSLEDGGSNDIGFFGFDHDSAFGGSSGSNTVATYDLGTATSTTKIAVSLVWNLDVEGAPNAFTPFDQTATVYNLDLELIDVTSGSVVVATSDSLIDTTENIWFTVQPNRDYQLRVSLAATQSAFNWDYSIAWGTQAPPEVNVPLPNWMMIALAILLACGRRVQVNQVCRSSFS